MWFFFFCSIGVYAFFLSKGHHFPVLCHLIKRLNKNILSLGKIMAESVKYMWVSVQVDGFSLSCSENNISKLLPPLSTTHIGYFSLDWDIDSFIPMSPLIIPSPPLFSSYCLSSFCTDINKPASKSICPNGGLLHIVPTLKDPEAPHPSHPAMEAPSFMYSAIVCLFSVAWWSLYSFSSSAHCTEEFSVLLLFLSSYL